MYTSGHITILKEALRDVEALLGRPLFEDPKDVKELMAAISYPDFPCGKIHDGVNGSLKQRRCNPAKFITSLLFKKLSFVYQSHNGFYSLWHAMSIDPDRSVSNIAKNVAEYILICFHLALEKRSPFWLGFGLHIIMDAYSPAHILREGAHGQMDAGDIVTYVQMHDSELTPGARLRIRQLQDIVDHVVAGVANGNSYEEIVGRQPRHLRSMAAFVLFDHLQRLRLPKDLLPTKTLASSSSSTRHRILNFYYYPHQPLLFHSLHDRLAAVKAAGLYRPCVEDIRDVLLLYKKHEDAHQDIHVTLRHINDIIRTRTLALHPGCLNADTGFDIALLLRPTLKVLTFISTPSKTRTFVVHGQETLAIRLVKRQRHPIAQVTFDIPFVINAATRPTVTYKRVNFTKVESLSMTRPDFTVPEELQYTFIVGQRHRTPPVLGYPVSIASNRGWHCMHPVLRSP